MEQLSAGNEADEFSEAELELLIGKYASLCHPVREEPSRCEGGALPRLSGDAAKLRGHCLECAAQRCSDDLCCVELLRRLVFSAVRPHLPKFGAVIRMAFVLQYGLGLPAERVAEILELDLSQLPDPLLNGVTRHVVRQMWKHC